MTTEIIDVLFSHFEEQYPRFKKYAAEMDCANAEMNALIDRYVANGKLSFSEGSAISDYAAHYAGGQGRYYFQLGMIAAFTLMQEMGFTSGKMPFSHSEPL